jgi:hypothetical protein
MEYDVKELKSGKSVVVVAGKGNIGPYKHKDCARSVAQELNGREPSSGWRDCKTCAPEYAD